jgi:hypothetical protein
VVQILKAGGFFAESWQDSEIIVLGGPSGTGKTELTLNLATYLRKALARECELLDLDFVKSDFTLRSGRYRLEVPLRQSFSAARFSEYPVWEKDVLKLFSGASLESPLIIDLGGDERGLRIFRSLAPFWQKKRVYCSLVVNFHRPFFESVESYFSFVHQMKKRVGIRFHSLILNDHLGHHTDETLVKQAFEKATLLSQKLALPIWFVAVWEELGLPFSFLDSLDCAVLGIRRYLSLAWNVGGDEANGGFQKHQSGDN